MVVAPCKVVRVVRNSITLAHNSTLTVERTCVARVLNTANGGIDKVLVDAIAIIKTAHESAADTCSANGDATDDVSFERRPVAVVIVAHQTAGIGGVVVIADADDGDGAADDGVVVDFNAATDVTHEGSNVLFTAGGLSGDDGVNQHDVLHLCNDIVGSIRSTVIAKDVAEETSVLLAGSESEAGNLLAVTVVATSEIVRASVAVANTSVPRGTVGPGDVGSLAEVAVSVSLAVVNVVAQRQQVIVRSNFVRIVF